MGRFIVTILIQFILYINYLASKGFCGEYQCFVTLGLCSGVSSGSPALWQRGPEAPQKWLAGKGQRPEKLAQRFQVLCTSGRQLEIPEFSQGMVLVALCGICHIICPALSSEVFFCCWTSIISLTAFCPWHCVGRRGSNPRIVWEERSNLPWMSW
jgi:hypothetical protein